MKENNLKNIVVLKNLPSNIVEEAFVILKSNKNARKLERIEKSKNSASLNTINKDNNYVLKEAEMIISSYLSRIENNKNQDSKKKLKAKYRRVKKYAYISSVIIFLQALMLMLK